MGAVRHTLAAVDTDEGFAGGVEINGVNRTGFGTVATLNAKLPLDNHAPPFALKKCTCWTGQSAWGRITSQAGLCLKSG
jgi:hypothetical protein